MARPYVHVTEAERSRRRKAIRDEAEARGRAIRAAEWNARFGTEYPGQAPGRDRSLAEMVPCTEQRAAPVAMLAMWDFACLAPTAGPKASRSFILLEQ
jgi:hypothetical protein